MESLDILAWVIARLRADEQIAFWAISVQAGLAQNAALVPPYIVVGLQSDVSSPDLSGQVSDGRTVVQVSCLHHDLSEAGKITARFDVALSGARRDEVGQSHFKAARVGSLVVPEPATLAGHKAGDVDGQPRIQGARKVLHRCATLWAVTYQPVVSA